MTKYGWSVVLKGMNKGKVYKRDCPEELNLPVFKTRAEARAHAKMITLFEPMTMDQMASFENRLAMTVDITKRLETPKTNKDVLWNRGYSTGKLLARLGCNWERHCEVLKELAERNPDYCKGGYGHSIPFRQGADKGWNHSQKPKTCQCDTVHIHDECINQ